MNARYIFHRKTRARHHCPTRCNLGATMLLGVWKILPIYEGRQKQPFWSTARKKTSMIGMDRSVHFHRRYYSCLLLVLQKSSTLRVFFTCASLAMSDGIDDESGVSEQKGGLAQYLFLAKLPRVCFRSHMPRQLRPQNFRLWRAPEAMIDAMNDGSTELV